MKPFPEQPLTDGRGLPSDIDDLRDIRCNRCGRMIAQEYIIIYRQQVLCEDCYEGRDEDEH